MMRIVLLTDIPVWVKPLADALGTLGADVVVAASIEAVPPEGLIVNRLSTLLVRKDPALSRSYIDALKNWEREGRTVVNGSRALALGYSKLAQAKHFEAVGVGTPRTHPACPGERAIPGHRVLLKPEAGGFGKGIRELDENSPVPTNLREGSGGWVEQALLEPSDGCVHRVEFLGTRILYEACSTLRAKDYNYCLANTEAEVVLQGEEDMSPRAVREAKQVAASAGMELGAVEYLLGEEGIPVFIDLNPVSSLHPKAKDLLLEDPLSLTARYLRHRSKS
ncbi:MAG: hypothetical protein LAT55_12255 [Opitutales bacterium]|nr:hypothetical protein [Opitutales bacterium]